ncbi:MAG: M36 family metallopeptidase, partial [Holophagae bacterium]|nr:M36 family metallopeptidase [Holophagae bacterium]
DRGLHFGDGYVDDAEDVEIVLHEFGHAIQHNAIPGLGVTWEAGSQDEGTSDYIAATFSGDTRYPDTLGEWDAKYYDPNPEHVPPRLRPIVTDRHYPEDMFEPYPLTGNEDIHWDGVIWSSTLWQVRNHIGAEPMDSILMKALPTMTPDTYYSSSAVRLLNAEISLYGGQYKETLRYFFNRRGILNDNYILNPQTDSEPFHLYFPMVLEDGEMTSHIGIINPTADPVNYSIQIIGENGCLVYAVENGTIPGNGRIWTNPLRDKVQAPCWVMISSTGQLTGYTSIVSRNLDRSCFLPAVDHLSDSLIVPHIAIESDYWDTETSLVNVSDQIPVVQFQSPNETAIDIDGLDRKYSGTEFDWLTEIYGGTFPEEFSGWGTLSADSAVLAGVETFRKKGEDVQQLAGFLLNDSSNVGQVLYFPHVAVQGDYWWTGIVLENISESDIQLTLTPYDKNGTALETVTFSLPANSKAVKLIQDFWTGNGKEYPSATAWVKAEISGSQLVGFELFGTLKGKGDRLLAGVPGAGEPVSGLIFPHVSTDSDYWTGIVVLNTGFGPCALTVEALDNSGTVLQTETPVNPLQPNEKWVLLAKDIFSGGIPAGTTQIRVHGNEPMVGFELWGNLVPQQDYISGISAIPIVE